MAALHNAFKSYLDENRFWSYRETLFETIAVLWISTSISAELVKRYFPDWRASRIDTETESLGFLWRMLGHDRSSWDRALSFWKLSNNTVCQNNSDSFPVPTGAEVTIGYMGTYATLTATALLYLLFFFSLVINKSWRHPNRLFTVPAFHQFEKLFRICGHNPQRCELVNAQPEPHVKRCTDECNDIVKEDSTFSCRDLGSCVVEAFLRILLIIPFGCSVSALIISWAVVSLLPVVAVATAVARTASVILGKDTVFPCYVLLALGLVVYSAGRMAGLWMRSSYLLWICGVTSKTKTKSSESNSKTTASFDTIVEPRSTLAVSNILGYLFALYVFSLSLIAKVDLSRFPQILISAWDYATNGSDLNSNGTKGLCYWDAIYSYWVNNSILYDYSTFPEPSYLSQAVGSFCGTWTTIWFGCFFMLQLLLLLLLEILEDNAMGSLRKLHNSSPTDKRYPKWYTYWYGQRPKLAKCARCAQFLALFLSWTIFQTPVFAVAVLPFPVLELFVPEQYHLPGLILILTACAVAVVTTSVHWLRGHRSAYQLYPYDPLGEKLSCGQHPLCGKYRKNDKRKCETAEGEPILKIAVAELEINVLREDSN